MDVKKMKLYLKDGTILKIDQETKLELIDLDDFINGIEKGIGNYICHLKYKLTYKDQIYTGMFAFDSYHGIKNCPDTALPISIELMDWYHLDEEDGYLLFLVNNN